MKTKTLKNFKCIDKGFARIYKIMQGGKINSDAMFYDKLDKEGPYYLFVGEFIYDYQHCVGEMIISESDLINLIKQVSPQADVFVDGSVNDIELFEQLPKLQKIEFEAAHLHTYFELHDVIEEQGEEEDRVKYLYFIKL